MEEELDQPLVLAEEIPVFMRCFVNNEENIAKYRMFGPSNPLVNSCREDEDFEFCPYVYDGICYMMTCKCRNEDPDNPDAEWFNGRCNYVDPDGFPCRVVFDEKMDAWRTPLDEGGFNGCFCRDHFRRGIPRPDDKEEFSLFHTLCDICVMVREKYPIQRFQNFTDDSNVTIYNPNDEDDYI